MSANRYSERWFALFAEAEAAQTELEVDFLVRQLPSAQTILDVACGYGRHARRLAARGYRVTGVEREARVIEDARRRVPAVEFLRLDMRRLDTIARSFDAVLSLWQSFGYFSEEANTDMLRSMAAKVSPTGRLVFDVYHRGFFELNQGTFERRVRDVELVESRTVTDGRLRVTLDYGGPVDVFDWQVYLPEELEALAADVGLELVLACTDFDELSPPSPESPRMQLVFESP